MVSYGFGVFRMISFFETWLSSLSLQHHRQSVKCSSLKCQSDKGLTIQKKILLSIMIWDFNGKKHQLKHKSLCAGNIWWKQASRQRWIAPTLGPKKPWCALRPRARAELQEKLRSYSASLNVLLGGSPGYAKQKSPCVIRLINSWL